MKRSLFFGLPLMTLAACAGNALGADFLTALGSRICDSTRTALVAIDASYTLTDNNDKIIFCAAAQDDNCRPDGGNQCSLEYRELAGSWATVPTSNAGGPSLASSGTSLSNNSTVTDPERRCNAAGGFRASAKEYTTSTSLGYSVDWRDDNSEAQWALDFSTDPGGKTYEFRVQWQTSNCGTVTITYPAQITTVVSHHWDLDETSGTTAADSIGSSDGTLWGFPGDDSQWTCSNGGSLTFDGVDDYVALPTESDYDFTGAVTVAAWIQVTSFNAAEQAIVTKGDTAWRLERNANDGTLTNMDGSEWTTGKVDNGLDLDGGMDYIETGIASNLVTTATMMAWFNSDDAGSIGDNFVDQRFITQRDTGTSSRLALGINLDRVAVFYDNGGNITEEGTTALVAGVWYHAAQTYDGATIRLYLNGVEEGNWAEGSLSAPSADSVQIGCNYAATRLFDGILDDVRLYSRALCATEVDAIYKQGAAGVRIVSWQEVDPFP